MSLLIERIDKTITALVRERARLAGDENGLADAAYQGAPGAFSEDAALAFLGTTARLHPCRTLDDVFQTVVSGRARWGVVPTGNTLAGPVPGCAELLRRFDVSVLAEQAHRIRHAVIAVEGARLSGVRVIRSHPVALAQCRRFFAAHASITAMPSFDTAGAVAEVVECGHPDQAAIASARAAGVHGAVVLATDVQDVADNFTRFVLFEAGRRA